ncbi:MAG: hypothetical protein E7544_07980 [Ruminococcaceae bacterium]|nr:hypothetical protein [Oscillospiraceae bacterium]
MKKFLSILLAIVLVLLTLPVSMAGAEYSDWITSTDGLYSYTLKDGNATLVFHNVHDDDFVYTENFIIPETVDGYPVVGIGESFDFGSERVTIPGDIKEIEGNPFRYAEAVVSEDNQNFTLLDNVLFTEDMTTLISYPKKKADKEYTIPESVTTIGKSAFEGAKNLETVVMSDNVTTVGESSFARCESLKNVTLSENLEVISKDMFSECKALETIEIPASVKTISSGAFFFCGLKNVKLNEGLETIEFYAFAWCMGIERINIPTSVTTIGNDVFEYGEEIVEGANHPQVTIVCQPETTAAKYAAENDIKCELTDKILATSVNLNATSIRWPIGKSGNFKATILPAEASQEIKWETDNPKVATIDENGKLTSVGNGVAIITCSTTDGTIGNLKEKCVVTVGPYVSEITFDDAPTILGVGRLQRFYVTVLPYNAHNRSVTWESSNPEVASVNSFGEVKALSVGTTTLICTAKDGSGKSGSCEITVKDIASELHLNTREINWTVGMNGHFKATVIPESAAGQKLTWTSSNKKVATVNSNGKLTAVGVGTATIICKTTDGSELKAGCTVTVGKPVTSVKLNCKTINWPVGKSASFKATVSPSDAMKKKLSWSSSNPGVATVSSTGKLTAVGVGTTTITCKATDGSGKYATCTVTVGKLVSDVKLNCKTINWPVGKSASFKATVSPSNAANKKLSWTSSNPKVATVSSTGKLTAVGAGTTTITCKATDGSGKYATCKVTVKAVKVTGVALNAKTINWPVGKSASFKATVSPSNATNKKLTWTSSNPKVATVSSSGKLTAVGAGTTTITCKATDGSGKYATCKVTVKAVKVTSVRLNAKVIVWEAGKTGSFKPTVEPSNATNQKLKWESLNPQVATVSSTGKLTAVSAGTAKIVCKATDGSGAVAYCQVLVTEKGKPENYTERFKAFMYDGTYAINGYTYVKDGSGSYKMSVQLAMTPSQSYMYQYNVDNQTSKIIYGPKGTILVIYGLRLADIFTLAEAKELGLPIKHFYTSKDYYVVYDKTPFENIYLDNLTYKYTDKAVINGTEYVAEHFAAKGENAETVFYYNHGRPGCFEMKNGDESILIEETKTLGSFESDEYKIPSGALEIPVDVWECLL